MSPAQRRILTALRERPRHTGELAQPDIGGTRFGARLQELRDLGYRITEQRVRQGKSRYTLTSEPDQPAKPGVWGREKACVRCGHRWQATGMWAKPCPSCRAGLHWTEDHWFAADADQVAAAAKAAGRNAA